MRSTRQMPDRLELALLVCLGLLAAVIWTGSLFAGFGLYPLSGVRHIPADKGWELLRLGWLGPLSLSVAWYGNILLLICAGMLVCGRVPSFTLATVGLAVAASSLLPVLGFDGRWGFTWSLVRGPAVWQWLSAFVIVWLPAAYSRWISGAGKSHKKL